MDFTKKKINPDKEFREEFLTTLSLRTKNNTMSMRLSIAFNLGM